MGTDMRAHLEYNQAGNYWISLSRWDLIRNYDLYRLLANVRGEGVLYPPRGVPRDIGIRTRMDYLAPVVGDAAQLPRQRQLDLDTVFLTEDQRRAASAQGEWWDSAVAGGDVIGYVPKDDTHSGSWLTTAEFRRVIEHYVAHVSDWWMAEYVADLESRRDELGVEEYLRRLATPNWDTSKPPEQYLHTEFWMLLAAMEAGEAAGFQVRLTFWFHG
jgi:hypothetical protein